MGNTNDKIIGTRVGIFDVLYECDFKSNDGHKMYHVRCYECGWESDMRKSNISTPKICKHVHNTWQIQRIGKIFNMMKKRCYDISDKSYKWYGQKGIHICDEWMNSPECFEDWALNNGYQEGLSINRIDPNKDYCPDNCEWISRLNNSKYKSTTFLLDVDGEVHTGREWADVVNVGTNIINTMLRNYSESQVKEFIRRRKLDMSMHPISIQSWMKVYGII